MDREKAMLDARILQAQGYTQAEIGERLGVSDRTVRTYLSERPRPRKTPVRASKLDPYKGFLEAEVEKRPNCNGELLYERIVKMGYTGRKTVMKAFVATVRKRIAAVAVRRFETEPGRQAQVDWLEIGKRIVDGRERKLYAFTMLLGYSRRFFVRFTTSMDTATLLACHELAFRYFGGVPDEILYDNMKTAFLCDGEGEWRATKRLAAFASHYGFVPRRCQVRRPETKGKVERAIGYVEGNFWPRVDAESVSLDLLNDEILRWLAVVDAKLHADLGETRRERFQRECLKPIPAAAFDVRDEIPVMVSRESTIRFRTNSYSVPPRFIGELVSLRVHPLHKEVELVARGIAIRSFILAEEGSKKQIDFPEDRVELRKRWELDRRRTTRLRRPGKRVPKPLLDVETRSPAQYERLFCDSTRVEEAFV